MSINFSVIIPTRDGERYLGATLDSVLAQTYPHFRVFVLESGSTDRTVEIVKAYDDPRVILLSHPEPLGMIENWRRILTLDLDDYLTILGHDDLLYPDFLAEIARLIAAEPAATLYQTQIDYIDGEGKPVNRAVTIPYAKPVARKETADEFMRAVVTEVEAVCATGYVMRSADYRAIGGIPEYPNFLYADVEAWYKLAILGYKAAGVHELAAFRLHGANTHRVSDLVVYFDACARYLDFCLTTGYFRELGGAAAVAYVNELFWRSHRNALLTLVLDGTRDQWAAYNSQIPRLKERAAKDGRLKLYDVSSRLHQTLARVPIRALRVGLLSLYRKAKKVESAGHLLLLLTFNF